MLLLLLRFSLLLSLSAVDVDEKMVPIESHKEPPDQEHPSQERSSRPTAPGSALGTRAKGLNLKRALNLKSRTHRSAVDESEPAAVHATNGAYRQDNRTAAAPLPSRLSKLS